LKFAPLILYAFYQAAFYGSLRHSRKNEINTILSV